MRGDTVLALLVGVIVLGFGPVIGYNALSEGGGNKRPPSIVQIASDFPFQPLPVQLAAESRCLADAMYHEARGEGVEGQMAVAEVVLERTQNVNYRGTICAVVYAGLEPGRLDCQFSFACDGALRRSKEEPEWSRTNMLANQIILGRIKLRGHTRRAIAYHSVDVNPFWAKNMIKTAQIGNHLFYRFSPQRAAKK